VLLTKKNYATQITVVTKREKQSNPVIITSYETQ